MLSENIFGGQKSRDEKRNIFYICQDVFPQTCVANMYFDFTVCWHVARGVYHIPVAEIKQISILYLQISMLY